MIKKVLILFILIPIIFSCTSKNKKEIKPPEYLIKGKITGFDDSTKVFLLDINLDKDIDSTYIINNEFSFKGRFDNDSVPEQIRLKLKDATDYYYTNLLFKNGDTVTITGDKKDFPYYLNKSGAKIQEEMNILDIKTRDLDSEYDKLVKTYLSMNKTGKENKGDSIKKRLNEINNILSQITKEYIIDNPNTFNAIIALGYNKKMFSKDTLKKILENIDPVIRKSKYGKALEIYAYSKIVDENEKYYNFTAQDQRGNKVNFADLFGDGKYILLDFTATYCGPCVQAVKELKEIHNKYSGKIKIVSFCVDAKKEVWNKGLKRDKVNWISLWDGKGKFSNTYIRYGIQGVPTFFLINPDGIVIKKQSGYGENVLTKILKENGVINNNN